MLMMGIEHFKTTRLISVVPLLIGPCLLLPNSLFNRWVFAHSRTHMHTRAHTPAEHAKGLNEQKCHWLSLGQKQWEKVFQPCRGNGGTKVSCVCVFLFRGVDYQSL